jgi:Rod binding domain-containing protein
MSAISSVSFAPRGVQAAYAPSTDIASSRGFLRPDDRLAARAREGDTRGLALEAARTLVSEAFIKPIFAQLREGSLASEAFKPGVAEKRFRPLLDAALSDAVVAKSGFGIVEVVADQFERAIGRGVDSFTPSARPAAGAGGA